MIQNSTSDDDRQVGRHEAAKATIEQDLHAVVALRAESDAHRDVETLDRMAEQVKSQAVADVAGAAKMADRRKGLARTVQVIDFLFGVVYVLLAVRMVLGLIGANQETGFVKFIVAISNPFFAYFRGIVDSPTVSGGYTIALSILVAVGAYALLHWGVRSLARLIAYRRSEI